MGALHAYLGGFEGLLKLWCLVWEAVFRGVWGLVVKIQGAAQVRRVAPSALPRSPCTPTSRHPRRVRVLPCLPPPPAAGAPAGQHVRAAVPLRHFLRLHAPAVSPPLGAAAGAAAAGREGGYGAAHAGWPPAALRAAALSPTSPARALLLPPCCVAAGSRRCATSCGSQSAWHRTRRGACRTASSTHSNGPAVATLPRRSAAYVPPASRPRRRPALYSLARCTALLPASPRPPSAACGALQQPTHSHCCHRLGRIATAGRVTPQMWVSRPRETWWGIVWKTAALSQCCGRAGAPVPGDSAPHAAGQSSSPLLSSCGAGRAGGTLVGRRYPQCLCSPSNRGLCARPDGPSPPPRRRATHTVILPAMPAPWWGSQ